MALVYAEKGLSMRKMLFGENANQPDIADSYEQVHRVYWEKGLQEESMVYLERFADIVEAVKEKFVKNVNL